jgi:MoaA/NifB/PqqE/SkfB family radical SAM enzyme
MKALNFAISLKKAFECRLCTTLGFPMKPRMINFAVTNQCNLLCITCNIGRNYLSNPSIARNDLKIGEIDALFFNNYALLKDVETIQITGGEPFMRNDLLKIIAVIHRYLPKCSIWIATNGTMPNLIIEEVQKIAKIHKHLSIGVSLDGGELIHDQIHGIKGTYSKALQTLVGLVELKKHIPWIKIAVSFTITPLNYKEIRFVYELSKKYNVWFTCRPTNISPIYYRNVERRTFFSYRNAVEEVDKAIKEIEKDLKKSLGFFEALPHRYFLSGIRRFIMEGRLTKRYYRCYAGLSSFFLDASGNVFPCIVLNRKMGNIRESSFEDIWKSKRATEIRRQIQEFKCPNCWVECETYANMFEDFAHLAAFFLKALLFR